MIKYNSTVLGLGLVSMVAGLWLVYWSPDSLHAFIRYGMGSTLSAIGGSYAIIHSFDIARADGTGAPRFVRRTQRLVVDVVRGGHNGLPAGQSAVSGNGSPPSRMVRVGCPVDVGSVVLGALAIVMRVRRGPAAVVEDERDRAIAARAERWARGALTFCLIGLWVMLWFSPDRRLQWATPKMLACVIFFMLLSASLARNAVAAAMYWRDRR